MRTAGEGEGKNGFFDVEAEELQISLPNGLVLAAKAWGNPEKEPWLALHGWLDNANSFDVLAKELHRYLAGELYLVCVEHAGHGLSSHRPGDSYHFIDYCSDACEAADALGWEKFSLLGHSLGGSVASVVAGAFPERISRLVMVEAIGAFGTTSQESPEAFAASVRAQLRKPNIYPTVEAAAVRRSEANVVGTLPLEAARLLAARGVEASTEQPGFVWRYDPALKLPSRARLTHATVEEYFRRIACPTMVVLAEDGIFEPAKVGRWPLYTWAGRMLMNVIYPVIKLLQWLPFLGKSAKLAKAAAKARMGLSFARRFALIHSMTWKMLPTGGHHPHMSPYLAPSIAYDIATWRKKQS